MTLIHNNPFRIAGILANTAEKELQNQKSKITKYASIGKHVDAKYDFSFLGQVDRTENSINKAFSEIELNQSKIRHALFWFLIINPFDETAISYLITGNRDKAIEIWEKVTDSKDVTSKNYSCFNNLGTIKLLCESKEDIKKGIEAKIKLIESPCFADFVHAVADQTYTIDNQKQTEKLVDDILSLFKGRYSSLETLKLFSSSNGTTQKYLSQKFTEEPLHLIETQIETTKNKRKTNKSGAYEFGLKLFANCKDDLATIKSLLGNSDLKYQMVSDNLANEIMQCGIDYFNESQDSNSTQDFLNQAQKLNKLALSIAVGRLVRDRAKDHITTLEEMKDREVLQAIALLKSVKDAYETNEEDIRQQVKELEETDPLIKLGHRTINHAAVEDNIKNSIDWVKVNDLLKAVLFDKNLEKIKACSNNELKADFVELANWLVIHSQDNALISKIRDKYKKIPPKLPFKILSSEITNTNNKPLFNKYIRYVGLKLNIEVKENASINFFLKYINPDGSTKRNSEISPVGYSISNTEIIEKQTSIINFPGWGNAEECTYAIGEHRIEVYVDEYLIHTIKYKVDFAPSEKIKKEIAIAEKELAQIKERKYRDYEIRAAKNKLIDINQFELFRTSASKQRQIDTIQKQIDQLLEEERVERAMDISVQEEKIKKLKHKLLTVKH